MSSQTSEPEGLSLENRGFLVAVAHFFFLVFAAILVATLYYGARDLVLAFIGFEAVTFILAALAALSTESLDRFNVRIRRVLPRWRPSFTLPPELRWLSLSVGILVGFYASGVLIRNTGGPFGSPFVQFPLTMLVLGALMTDLPRTAVGLILFGVAYAAVLVWVTDGFVAVGHAETENADAVFFLTTALNVAIGVGVSFLSRDSERSQSGGD
jgi:hypothetical protein